MVNGDPNNNARLYDANLYRMAGLPLPKNAPKDNAQDVALFEKIKHNIQLLDRQDALNRYVWTGLPKGLTGDMIERILYYKGQAMLFYMESDDTFYFLPYALDGEIDCYGRYLNITPVPFGSGATRTTDGKIQPWIPGLIRKPIYTIDDVLQEITPADYTGKCVIFRDYSNGINQINTPRVDLQQGIIDTMARCIPYMRTALMNSTGIQGVKVGSQPEQLEVFMANAQVENASLSGMKYLPMVGNLDFQDLSGGNVAKSEEFMLAMQSLDNFRLGQYGIKNGGVFAKKAHMLQDEQDTNQGNTGLIYNDGLALRQYGCILCNLLFGLDMWCEASETVLGLDKNLDGEMSDEQDGQLPMDHPQAQLTAQGGDE